MSSTMIKPDFKRFFSNEPTFVDYKRDPVIYNLQNNLVY
jgi:hypothetical protein